MTDQALDDLARRVILDAARQEYGDWIDQLPEHDFSPAFEKKMQKLIHRANHPIRYQVVKIAACLLLTAFLSGCAVLAVSPEAREVFTGWVRELYYGTLVYRYTGPQGERPEDMIYRPMWVPKGYEVYDESPNLSMSMIVYYNKQGERLDFITYGSKETMSINVVMEEKDTEKEILVAGKPASLYLSGSGGTNILIWMDEENHLAFMLTGIFSEQEAIQIAESVQLTPLQTPPHRPSWVPDGYSFQGLNGENTGADIELYYGKETGEQLQFYYWGSYSDVDLPDSVLEMLEGSEIQNVFVDSFPAKLYLGADGVNRLFCIKEDDYYWITGPVSSEELIQIAESIGVQPTK